MKLAIVTENILSDGAYAQVADALATYLTRTGMEVHYYPYPGKPLYSVPIKKPYFIHGLAQATSLRTLCYCVVKMIEEDKPDLILVIGDLFAYSFLLPLREQGFKIACTAIIDGEPVRAIERDLYPKVIPLCLTQYGIEQLERIGITGYYFPHFVDLDIYYPEEKKPGAEEIADKFTYLYVGANNARKNIGTLLKAYGMLGLDDACLVLHTRPYTSDGLMIPDFIKKHNIKNVYFSKGINWRTYTKAEMRQVYNQGDVFVSATTGEGFGLCHLESMACGLPQITTGYSALPEVIGEAGLFIKPNGYYYDFFGTRRALISPEELSKAMKQVYEDRELLRKLSRKAIIQARKYSADKILPQLAEVIASLMS